ncbi:hypothetical protein GJ744_007145 [Endocarpon pusillum]|uniref:Uncharacterized protein n=2 Tax=Endocarpon pusillum TaxID=364733 RepID=A0A8H7E7S2_9EURO|nr:hypothetical protein GJ744_007145 [Endocarpon pusillum]
MTGGSKYSRMQNFKKKLRKICSADLELFYGNDVQDRPKRAALHIQNQYERTATKGTIGSNWIVIAAARSVIQPLNKAGHQLPSVRGPSMPPPEQKEAEKACDVLDGPVVDAI